MYAIFLDAFVIFVFIIAIFLSYKRGFLRGIFLLGSRLISICIAFFLSNPLSEWIFEHMFRTSIYNQIFTELGKSHNISDAFDHIFKVFSPVIQSFFLNRSSADHANELLMQNNMSEIARMLTDSIIKPILTTIISVCVFFLMYFLLRLIFKLLSKSFGLIQHIPVLGIVNSLLGAILGIVHAIITLLLAATLVKLLIICINPPLSWLNEDIISHTTLFWCFYKFNFLNLL